VQSCPIDCRRALYRNISLSGGTTMLKHFGARIQVAGWLAGGAGEEGNASRALHSAPCWHELSHSLMPACARSCLVHLH